MGSSPPRNCEALGSGGRLSFAVSRLVAYTAFIVVFTPSGTPISASKAGAWPPPLQSAIERS
jgi:hypothetical protein